MPIRFYRPQNAGTELDLYIDPQTFVKVDDDARILKLVELQSLSDSVRADVAMCYDFPDLASFDTALQEESDMLKDRVDYYAYDNRTENFSVRDGAWFTPEAIESFCGETGTNVATNSIDGDNGTSWRHAVNETHHIVYRIRSYPKKISKIRFRYNTAEPVTEQLANITVRAAQNLRKIDDAANLLESGITIVWTGLGGTWVEHVLASKKSNARYIKLEFTSAHATNTAQVREFQVRVETRDP